VVATQARLADALGAQEIAVVATAAVRDAKNRDEFELAVAEESGLPVRVLSEDEEARLAFLGATRTFSGPLDGLVAVVDVGGGSTEIVIGTLADGVSWAESFRIGSGFLADAYFHSDPPAPAELTAARLHVAGSFEGLEIPPAVHAVATGGSANALRRLIGAELVPETLERALRVLRSGRASEVAGRFQLETERVRVMPAGALVFEELSSRLDLPLRACKGGVREGVILDLLAGATTMSGARSGDP
jgi:exopolyphosphatase / guanosine-5'-triphosphate,3'-diphosphate pyrophosphatase